METENEQQQMSRHKFEIERVLTRLTGKVDM